MNEVPFRRSALRYAYGLRFFTLSKTAACDNVCLITVKDGCADGDPSGIYPCVHRRVQTPLSPQHLLSLHIGLLMHLPRSRNERRVYLDFVKVPVSAGLPMDIGEYTAGICRTVGDTDRLDFNAVDGDCHIGCVFFGFRLTRTAV